MPLYHRSATQHDTQKRSVEADLDPEASRPHFRRQQLDTTPNALVDALQTVMKERFMLGLEADFDYSRVDDNEEYDDLGMRAQVGFYAKVCA